jgi:hypothetical protein
LNATQTNLLSKAPLPRGSRKEVFLINEICYRFNRHKIQINDKFGKIKKFCEIVLTLRSILSINTITLQFILDY